MQIRNKLKYTKTYSANRSRRRELNEVPPYLREGAQKELKEMVAAGLHIKPLSKCLGRWNVVSKALLCLGYVFKWNYPKENLLQLKQRALRYLENNTTIATKLSLINYRNKEVLVQIGDAPFKRNRRILETQIWAADSQRCTFFPA